MVFEDGSDVNYEYDEASRLTKKTDIDDKVTEYGYRKDHLLKTLTVKRESQSDRVFTYSYDEAGRVTQVQYPGESQLIAYIDNGTPGTGWDRNGRLKHLRYELNGSPIRSFAYDYDESGNRTQATEVAGSTTTVYKYYYDWLDRLLRVEKGPNTSSLSPVSIYTYDESDNPTKLELPESFLEYDFTFDLASNIETRKETDTTVSSAPVVNFTENFTPDEDGNVLTRTRTVGADTHQITYEWDDFNKLVAVSASLNGSPAAEPKQSNAYAANGFRRQKTKKDGEIVTEYAEGLATAVAKAQAETITYIHGHQILGFEQGGQFYYFLTDALGSVRDIVDGTGQVVQQYQYDERGNHVIAPMSGGPASPKTFVGGLSVNDDTADGGLYLMGHRFYDPSLGRFLNRDPIGFAGGLNLFSYGANNPVTYTDHTGLEPRAHEVRKLNSFPMMVGTISNMQSGTPAVTANIKGGFILNQSSYVTKGVLVPSFLLLDVDVTNHLSTTNTIGLGFWVNESDPGEDFSLNLEDHKRKTPDFSLDPMSTRPCNDNFIGFDAKEISLGPKQSRRVRLKIPLKPKIAYFDLEISGRLTTRPMDRYWGNWTETYTPGYTTRTVRVPFRMENLRFR